MPFTFNPEFDNKSPIYRAKYNLKIHLIFVCKYRKKLLYGELDTFLKTVVFASLPF